MLRKHRLTTFLVPIMLGLLAVCGEAGVEAPHFYTIQGVPRIKQLRNYCGPACLASVMRYYGRNVTQEEIGGDIYDGLEGVTGGADMLVYAREKGFAAYSWNTSASDVKRKIAAGIPVIALQQNSRSDTSGHYRILTGYDDSRCRFTVIDPYYEEITDLTYSDCDSLWARMGYWALLIVPLEKDTFKAELDANNPVVHLDLSQAELKRKHYENALKEANLALSLEPGNASALSIIGKVHRAMGAGAK